MAVDSVSPAGDTPIVVQTTAKSTRTELVAILNHIPAMVGYWSNDLRNVFANEAYSERFGLSTAPSEMVLTDSLDEDDRDVQREDEGGANRAARW